jgi:hypothetical protein
MKRLLRRSSIEIDDSIEEWFYDHHCGEIKKMQCVLALVRFKMKKKKLEPCPKKKEIKLKMKQKLKMKIKFTCFKVWSKRKKKSYNEKSVCCIRLQY